ncbi:DNA primase [Kaistia dalseonensis]|uniref:DNA primase n=1 Tax=Kaistia dalseonensis TaxID=410840 RepID=A0ABU0HEK4_9HYPH|nr:DNA primase [Kaistia dalseonensis]MCX5497268.1 DNA primase [Kaistia dalseonensis]MDQ0439904.1 DNA primase [Kaistia dalseonensis]
MRFSPSFLDEIRARLPLSSIVGRRVTWDRRKTQAVKGDFWACCPFHGEKSPSFHADDRKGRYHCFGCGESGDHFTFLTKIEGLSFPEAVERLAGEAGLPMPARDARAEEEDKKRASLHEVMELACRYFEEGLQSRDGAQARGYLNGRALGPDIQRRFRLGYARSSRNALKEYLAAKGVPHEDMVATGLLISGEDIPVSYDRFRDRVMFPITDFRGRIVAFGGRALSPDVPAKYLNSPETVLFKKGDLLYNGFEARKAVQAAGTLIVVEGYVDVIAMVTGGFPHTVAPLGTALTEHQLDLLWRLTPEPILCFDGDKAGLRAAYRAVDLALPALKPGKTVRFALLPEGQDPDDLIRQSGREAMGQIIAASRPMVEMIWTRETEGGVFETPERRAALEARLRDIARTVGEETVRRYYEQALSERVRDFFGGGAQGRQGGQRRMERRFGGRQQADRPDAPRYVPTYRTQSTQVSSKLQQTKIRPAAGPRETVLVMTMVNHPALIADHFDALAEIELTNHELDSLRAQILEIAADEPHIDVDALRYRLVGANFGDLVDRLNLQIKLARNWQASADASEQDALDGWLQALTLHRKARTLHKELKDAEAALASDPSDANLAHLVDIQNQLANSDGTEALIEGFGATSGRRLRTM